MKRPASAQRLIVGSKSRRQQYPWMYAGLVLTLATVGFSLFLRQPGITALRIAAAACGVAAAMLMFLPIAALKEYGDVEPGGSYMDSTRVVDRGPFALVRHPQYLGYALICVTFALLSQHWLVTGLGVLSVACFFAHAIEEEQLMVAKFGDAYLEYMRRVPRFNILLGIYRTLW